MSALLSLQIKFVSTFGDYPLLIASFSLGFILLLLFFNYKKESILFLSTFLSVGYATVLKGLFRHPRPEGFDFKENIPFDVYSFPSSHVTFYVVYWGYILFLAFKLTRLPLIVRGLFTIVSLYFFVLVGASRVYLGAHFPKDVFAGYIFGLIFLMVLIFLTKQLDNSVTEDKKEDSKSR